MLRAATSTALLALLLAASAGAAAEVGDPPTDDRNRCNSMLAPCGDPIVVGLGRDFGGRTEIIAMSVRDGVCVGADARKDYTGCFGTNGPTSGVPAYGIDAKRIRHRIATQVTGLLGGEVASVEIRYVKNGIAGTRSPIMARVGGKLLRRLDHEHPFGFFAATIRGCVQPGQIRIKAFDDAGHRVDEEGPSAPPSPDFCDR